LRGLAKGAKTTAEAMSRHPQQRNRAKTKPRRGKARFITRAEARRRAARHILNQMFKGALVRDGMEADHNAYNVRHKDTWVVYKNRPVTGLQSSDVVVVCKRTGRVLYDGLAGDEG
jgi:hypothetical protein